MTDNIGPVIKRDRYGRYVLPDETGKERSYTRATTFAKAISDSFNLSLWSQRQVAKGLSLRPDLYALAASTPSEDRDGLNAIAEKAKEAAKSSAGASLGTALHSFCEQLDLGQEVTAPAPWDADVKAYQGLRDRYGLNFEPSFVERVVVNRDREVAGTFDRLVQVRDRISYGDGGTLEPGTWCVLDLKTGKDLSYGWLEIAIQLHLYASADMMWDVEDGTWEKLPDLDQVRGLVVHLPAGRAAAALHVVDLEAGSRGADLCGQVRDARKARGVGVAAEEPTIRPKDLPPLPTARDNLLAGVRDATCREDLADMWSDQQGTGTWTEEIDRAARKKAQSF
jgi:hypothetical protein